MKKSADEVLDDVYDLIRRSDLMDMIDGELYKDGTMRPLDSGREDAVMSFKAGLDGQIQEGALVVNIYVPDIDGGGGRVKNSLRTTEISRRAYGIFDRKVMGEYIFTLGKMVQTYREQTTGQHFVSVDLRFKRTTF